MLPAPAGWVVVVGCVCWCVCDGVVSFVAAVVSRPETHAHAHARTHHRQTRVATQLAPAGRAEDLASRCSACFLGRAAKQQHGRGVRVVRPLLRRQRRAEPVGKPRDKGQDFQDVRACACPTLPVERTISPLSLPCLSYSNPLPPPRPLVPQNPTATGRHSRQGFFSALQPVSVCLSWQRTSSQAAAGDGRPSPPAAATALLLPGTAAPVPVCVRMRVLWQATCQISASHRAG